MNTSRLRINGHRLNKADFTSAITNAPDSPAKSLLLDILARDGANGNNALLKALFRSPLHAARTGFTLTLPNTIYPENGTLPSHQQTGFRRPSDFSEARPTRRQVLSMATSIAGFAIIASVFTSVLSDAFSEEIALSPAKESSPEIANPAAATSQAATTTTFTLPIPKPLLIGGGAAAATYALSVPLWRVLTRQPGSVGAEVTRRSLLGENHVGKPLDNTNAANNLLNVLNSFLLAKTPDIAR